MLDLDEQSALGQMAVRRSASTASLASTTNPAAGGGGVPMVVCVYCLSASKTRSRVRMF